MDEISITLHSLNQVGAIVSYVLDAMRQKEAAFAAVWLTLGGVNLTLLFTGAAFPPGRPLPLGLLIMGVNSATLLVAGQHNAPDQWTQHSSCGRRRMQLRMEVAFCSALRCSVLSAGDRVAHLSGEGCEERQRVKLLGAVVAWTQALSVAAAQCGGVVSAPARHTLASTSIRKNVSVLCKIFTGASAGVWCTLQFRFVQLQYPSLALAFEQLVLAVSMPLGAAIQTWGVVAAVGASPAAFYLGALLAAMYFALAVPLQSSFYKEDTTGAAVGAVLPLSSPLPSPTPSPVPSPCPVGLLPFSFVLREVHTAHTPH